MRTFEKSAGIVERKVRDTHILVPLEGSGTAVIDSLYTLNETAGFIWCRAVAGAAEPAIADEVSATFDVERTRARTDVRTILNDLVRIGALREKRRSP